MKTITLSPKFQVVIPLSIRESLGLVVGKKVHVIRYDDRIVLIPVRETFEMRGFLRGISTAIDREPAERQCGRAESTSRDPPPGTSTCIK